MKKFVLFLALVLCVVSFTGFTTAHHTHLHVAAETEHQLYATPSGKCYHYSARCCGKNAKPITKADADRRGLRACSKCAK